MRHRSSRTNNKSLATKENAGGLSMQASLSTTKGAGVGWGRRAGGAEMTERH